jgi:hypothetical protein
MGRELEIMMELLHKSVRSQRMLFGAEHGVSFE